MYRFIMILPGALLALALVFNAQPASAGKDENKDYRTFHQGGKVEYGKIGDSYTSDLVLYLAGNQFMVMEELINDFMKKHPKIKTTYVETIPPVRFSRARF